MDTKKDIIYIDTNVFFTMLKNNAQENIIDDLTLKHLDVLIANDAVCIKIPEHQYRWLQELRTDDKQRKQILSKAALQLIDYFLDKRIFTFIAAMERDSYEEFIRFILRDLIQGNSVTLITNNADTMNAIKAKVSVLEPTTLQRFFIVSGKEVKQWAEEEVKKKSLKP